MMPLSTGTRLGSYELLAQIGAGGMGEVYKARDTKLGRDVAVKVLPEAFARDPERLSRFQREAKMLASLNHPNIATIYGLEQSNGVHFLIMELVPGETLRERIAKEAPVPIEEALKIGIQIAEALEAAHEKGIIHRDLKPANVKVTSEGKVKVLDFGLAKAFAGDESGARRCRCFRLRKSLACYSPFTGTRMYWVALARAWVRFVP
jgi:eukaryotic-like serine/threonine-protein kinase